MAAGKTDGCTTAETDTEDEISARDAHDLTPLRTPRRETEPCAARLNFRVFDAVLLLISLVTYLTDTLTDILVTVQYFQGGHLIWASLTIGFVAVPSFITQCFSLRWYQADGKLKGARMWLIHIFHLQPLERYIGVLMAGMDARTTGEYEKAQVYYYQQNDVSMLRLFEAFLESAPQLTLQLYIMVATNDASWLTGVSAGISLISVGWAVSIYNHALRQAHQDDYRLQWPSLLLHTLWHVGVIAARVCALVAFASLYKAWVFLFIGIHWVLMMVWVVLQRTDFCPTQPEERLFNAVVGVIYVFCFFSLKEGQTRWRLLFFYTVFFVENVVLVAVWYPFRQEDGWTTNALVAVVFGAFFLVILATIFGSLLTGIGCMMVYYRFCHPSGPIFCCPPVAEEHTPTLPRKASGIYQIQVDLLPRTSTALLSRAAQLKPQTSLAMAAPPVVYKEVHTPSQLTPVRQEPGCRRVINYNETLEVSDNSMFRHYSIEASQCMVESRCATLVGDGIDLTQAALDDNDDNDYGDSYQEGLGPAYSFSFIDNQSQASSTDDSGWGSNGERKLTQSGLPDSSGNTSPEVISSPEVDSSDQFSSGHGSAISRNTSGQSGGNQEGPDPVTPKLPHNRLLSVLPDFSPISDERKPGTIAGCSKFPTNLPYMAALASTPHGGLRPRIGCLYGKKPQDGSDSNADTGSKRSLHAPLASPEVSLTESMCNLDDASYYDDPFTDVCEGQSLNQSSYDNVPTSPKDVSLGAYLDNVSGVTYLSQGAINQSQLSTDQGLPKPILSIGRSQTSPCLV